MIIAISGANGFIGKKLTSYFLAKGNEVRNILRIHAETPAEDVATFLSDVDVVINLAGAPIAARWTEKYKRTLFNSRIITTRKIVEAISLLEKKPQLLISASAVGIYSPEGENTETKYKLTDDFLGKICIAWELEAKKAVPNTRVAIIRLGIVLSKDGGALKRMLPLFNLGFGGTIASGRQGFPWIHIYDVFHAIQFIIENKNLSGEFNFSSPHVIDNRNFTNELAKALKKKAFFNVPALALKLAFGEGAIAIAGGQFVFPKHLLEEGYKFSYPDLPSVFIDMFY